MDCGSCTACCTVLKIEVLDKPMNTPCQHCDGMGCSKYSARPQTCKEFECAYYQGKDVPEDLRPDKCGVIFIKRSNNIFSGMVVKGVGVSNKAKQQIQSFLGQGYSVVLLTEDEIPHIITHDDTTPELVFNEYTEILNGYVQH